MEKQHELARIGGHYDLLDSEGNKKGFFALNDFYLTMKDIDGDGEVKFVPYDDVVGYFHSDEPLTGPRFSLPWAGLGALLLGPLGAYMGTGMGKIKTREVVKVFFKDGLSIYGVRVL